MITLNILRELALSFPEATEEPHFENTSFRVKKKIFATFDPVKNLACLKLSEINQDVFSAMAPSVIYPVPNKWGKQGWTLVDVDKVEEAIFQDALTTAYCEVAPKRLSERVLGLQ
ncbi:MAG: MmcQ/YjbR family DNA-binding protein [Bacteroidia bacterium]|nr:MmcQ/YjbR family DNA-binding protein [Bacteroidia bacterium]